MLAVAQHEGTDRLSWAGLVLPNDATGMRQLSRSASCRVLFYRIRADNSGERNLGCPVKNSFGIVPSIANH
jgi:hypothetical protein